MKQAVFKFLLGFCVLLTVTNCQKDKPVKKKAPFLFDTVDHYCTDDGTALGTSLHTTSATSYDEVQLKYSNILFKDLQPKNRDTLFVTELQNLDYTKMRIDSGDVKEYQRIFSQKFGNYMRENACEPYYRDVYVFRKKNKIVGIAKICFDCQIINFSSEKDYWQQFGNSDKLKKLEQLKQKEALENREN